MITNKTKKTIIARKEKICITGFSKFLGLMFRFRVASPLVFVFKKKEKIPLHMIFVFCRIDVLFLDEKNRVVEMKERFLPFTFYFPKRKSKTVIELPAGTIRKTRTRFGDEILMQW